MTDFLINLPYHKRWWLPDGRHAYNSVIFGDEIKFSVIDMETMQTKESFTCKLDKDDKWRDLGYAFQEKANKKYPKQPRHKRNEAFDRAFRTGVENRHKKGITR